MAEKTEIEKIEHRIRKAFWNVQDEFTLIEPGDKVMACLSGGKDSYTMLEMLLHAQRALQNSFEIIAVNLDQKQPGFPEEILPKYLTERGVPFRIVEKDTYSIVMEKLHKGKTMCTICSRLRRGILYDVASEMDITKIALGHHREDVLETFFLNLFFAGKLEAMPAKYKTDDGRHIVIRPLVYAHEKDIELFAQHMQYPIIPCNLCGSQEGMQRAAMKKMLAGWEEKYPNRSEIMLTALKNIHPSHLFDKNHYDFQAYEQLGSALKNHL
ncbi:MAG TPA: tRNA 2-thiocytidine(32) synthetase TtcA [Flavobacteriales bacterium]|nr:tRNA 2-thiocytidine(32) synthetase TtcA [Flavobacteriales bacterium]